MASAVTSEKIGSRFSFEAFFHDPDTASAQYVTPDGGTTFYWRDLRDFEWFGVTACNGTLTGNGLTHLEIWAADDTSGTNGTVIVASATLSGTAVGNGGFVECTAEQVEEISKANSFKLRYVTAKITVANSADEACVAFIRGMAKFPKDALTPLTF